MKKGKSKDEIIASLERKVAYLHEGLRQIAVGEAVVGYDIRSAMRDAARLIRETDDIDWESDDEETGGTEATQSDSQGGEGIASTDQANPDAGLPGDDTPKKRKGRRVSSSAGA